MKIQRYFIGIARKDNDLEKIMTAHYIEEPDDEGRYVLYTDHLAALAEKDEEDKRVRMFLLFNHGHSAPYLDDGEMQCGECRPNWDYKRLPLKTLVSQFLGLRAEQLRLAVVRGDILDGKLSEETQKQIALEDRIKELVRALEDISTGIANNLYTIEEVQDIAKVAQKEDVEDGEYILHIDYLAAENYNNAVVDGLLDDNKQLRDECEQWKRVIVTHVDVIAEKEQKFDILYEQTGIAIEQRDRAMDEVVALTAALAEKIIDSEGRRSIARLTARIKELTEGYKVDICSECWMPARIDELSDIIKQTVEKNDPVKISERLLPLGFVVVTKDQWDNQNEQIATLRADLQISRQTNADYYAEFKRQVNALQAEANRNMEEICRLIYNLLCGMGEVRG
jgi:hypothetical protein